MIISDTLYASLHSLLVEADSMLSAAGHGRLVTKEEMVELSARIRHAYQHAPDAVARTDGRVTGGPRA